MRGEHLRPPSILRKLCYGDFAIHPDNFSTYDHGSGWSLMDPHALGKPRVEQACIDDIEEPR